MRLKFTTIAIVIVTLLLGSCRSDKTPTGPRLDKPTFSATVNKYESTPVSRAQDAKWDKNDFIGIYAMKSGEGIAASIDVNKKYTTLNGDGVFTPFTENQTIYFPLEGSLDFISFYPYTENIVDYKYSVNVTNQSPQAGIDLLYSNNAKGFNKTKPNVDLTFSHKLTKLYVTVQKGEGVDNLDGLTATIEGMPTKAVFELGEGKLSNIDAEANISAITTANGENQIMEAIIIPATVVDPKINFVLNGETFVWDFATHKTFVEGTKLVASIILKIEKELPVAITVSSNIVDWTEIPGGEHTITPSKPEGKGTKENPFTVKQLATKVGTTEVWVGGVIVGSDNAYVTRSEFTNKNNILIAESADVTERADMVLVELNTEEMQQSLNIVDNPQLLKQPIKVQGNITEVGGAIIITKLIAQVGGVDPKPTPEYISVYELLSLYTVGDVISPDTKLKGVVISDSNIDKNTDFKNIVVTDENTTKPHSGIAMRMNDASSGHGIAEGAVIVADLSSLSLTEYNGLTQIEIPFANVKVQDETAKVEPILLDNAASLADYESMLVTIKRAQAVKTGVKMAYGVEYTDGTNVFEVFTKGGQYGATFQNELVPTGSGALTGIVGFFNKVQISPRHKSDYEGLTGDRMGDVKYGDPRFIGVFKENEPGTGTITIPYDNGNRNTVSVSVTNDKGLNAVTNKAFTLVQGSGELTIDISGTSPTAGTVTFSITGLGATTLTATGIISSGGAGEPVVLYYETFDNVIPNPVESTTSKAFSSSTPGLDEPNVDLQVISGKVDIRRTKTIGPGVWFPAGVAACSINDILSQGKVKLTISLDIASNASTDTTLEGFNFIVKVNNQVVPFENVTLPPKNAYVSIKYVGLEIPAADKLSLNISANTPATTGARIDNIKIIGE